MAISYKKLWKLLVYKDMKKKDLCVAAGISHTSMAKLGKNENIVPLSLEQFRRHFVSMFKGKQARPEHMRDLILLCAYKRLKNEQLT